MDPSHRSLNPLAAMNARVLSFLYGDYMGSLLKGYYRIVIWSFDHVSYDIALVVRGFVVSSVEPW